jgi:hypothetical protein
VTALTSADKLGPRSRVSNIIHPSKALHPFQCEIVVGRSDLQEMLYTNQSFSWIRHRRDVCLQRYQRKAFWPSLSTFWLFDDTKTVYASFQRLGLGKVVVTSNAICQASYLMQLLLNSYSKVNASGNTTDLACTCCISHLSAISSLSFSDNGLLCLGHDISRCPPSTWPMRYLGIQESFDMSWKLETC